MLTGDGASEAALAAHVTARDGAATLATLYYLLQRACSKHRLLCHAASMAGERDGHRHPDDVRPAP